MSFDLYQIKIIYASASGNTYAVSNYVKEVLLGKGYDASLHRAESFDHRSFNKSDLFIFAISTWEHGEPNPHFDSLISFFKNNDIEIKCAFIGLGDLRYEPVKFCGGMNKVKELVTQSGGVEIVSPLRIDGDPHEKLDTMVLNWTNKLIGALTDEK